MGLGDSLSSGDARDITDVAGGGDDVGRRLVVTNVWGLVLSGVVLHVLVVNRKVLRPVATLPRRPRRAAQVRRSWGTGRQSRRLAAAVLKVAMHGATLRKRLSDEVGVARKGAETVLRHLMAGYRRRASAQRIKRHPLSPMAPVRHPMVARVDKKAVHIIDDARQGALVTALNEAQASACQRNFQYLHVVVAVSVRVVAVHYGAPSAQGSFLLVKLLRDALQFKRRVAGALREGSQSMRPAVCGPLAEVEEPARALHCCRLVLLVLLMLLLLLARLLVVLLLRPLLQGGLLVNMLLLVLVHAVLLLVCSLRRPVAPAVPRRRRAACRLAPKPRA